MSHILKPCPPSSPYGPAGPKFKQNGQRYPGGGGPQYYLRRTPLDESPPEATKVTRAWPGWRRSDKILHVALPQGKMSKPSTIY